MTEQARRGKVPAPAGKWENANLPVGTIQTGKSMTARNSTGRAGRVGLPEEDPEGDPEGVSGEVSKMKR